MADALHTRTWVIFGIVALFFILSGAWFLIQEIKKRRAKAYLQRHPESATVWMLVESILGTYIEKWPITVDGKKPVFQVYAEGYGLYLPPGSHALSIQLRRSVPGKVKPEPLRMLNASFVVEAGKSYIMRLNDTAPNVYLEEGYPPRSDA